MLKQIHSIQDILWDTLDPVINCPMLAKSVLYWQNTSSGLHLISKMALLAGSCPKQNKLCWQKRSLAGITQSTAGASVSTAVSVGGHMSSHLTDITLANLWSVNLAFDMKILHRQAQNCNVMRPNSCSPTLLSLAATVLITRFLCIIFPQCHSISVTRGELQHSVHLFVFDIGPIWINHQKCPSYIHTLLFENLCLGFWPVSKTRFPAGIVWGFSILY